MPYTEYLPKGWHLGLTNGLYFAMQLAYLMQVRGDDILACFIREGAFPPRPEAEGGVDTRALRQPPQRRPAKVPRKSGGPKRKRRSRIMKAPPGLKFPKVK